MAAQVRRWARAWRERYPWEEVVFGFLFLIPLGVLTILFKIYPIFYSFYLSLTKWNGLAPTPTWVGLDNYAALLQDATVYHALLNTAYYSVGIIVVGLPLALFLAALLNQRIRGRTFFRTVYFAPNIASTVAVSMVWLWLLNTRSGLINYLLSLAHVPAQDWLLNPRLAMPSVIAMTIWKDLGYDMVLFLAGLQGIPKEFYDAAKIDGAGTWGCFRHVTLPLLMPTTFLVLVLTTIGSFQVFTQVFVMTQGGPMGATDVIVYHIYSAAFENFQLGYGAALSYVLFVILFVLTLLQRRVAGRDIYY